MDGENKERIETECAKEKKNSDAPKNPQKKKAVIALSIMLALLVILPIISFVDWNSLSPKKEADTDRDSWISFYDDKFFRAPNYDQVVTDDEQYMQMDRVLYYKVGNENVAVVSNPDQYGRTCELFFNYFELVKSGDYENYYSLFTDSYAERHGDINFFTKNRLIFTAQKIYDIQVELKRSAYLENGDADGRFAGSTVYYFNVSYCIKDNDGTFRRDILSGESRTLVFELLETDDEVKISDISFIRPHTSNESK